MENLIEINPKIMVGKPVIEGTRITVGRDRRKTGRRGRLETIVSQFPTLSRDKVASAVRFALERFKQDFPPQTENRRLLESIDYAHAGPTDADEEAELRSMKKKAREI